MKYLPGTLITLLIAFVIFLIAVQAFRSGLCAGACMEKEDGCLEVCAEAGREVAMRLYKK